MRESILHDQFITKAIAVLAVGGELRRDRSVSGIIHHHVRSVETMTITAGRELRWSQPAR